MEDNPGDARLLTQALRDRGGGRIQVEHACSLTAALRALRNRSPDLILLDLNLPDSRGLDTLRAVREQASDTPTVVLTGMTSPSLAAEVLRDGADILLDKGHASADLVVGVIDDALAHENVRRSSCSGSYVAEPEARGEAPSRIEHATPRPPMGLRDGARESAVLAAIVASSNDAIIQKDLDGTIRAWNGGAERMYGYTEREVLGRNIEIIVPEDRRREIREILATLARGERVDCLETRRRTKSGRELWVSVTISPVFGPGGELQGASAIARDITDQRQTRQDLERLNAQLESYAQKLEQSNDDLQQFAYAASHDLREPLRAVLSYCTLLEENYRDLLDDEGRAFLTYAVGGARRMQSMIGDLLEYSRAGRTDLQPVPTPLSETLRGAIESLRSMVVETRAEITSDPLPTVIANPALITHVILNLLGNAMKFQRPGQTPRVHVTASRRGSMWLISVNDNGIGIEPRFRCDIFDVFRRLHTIDEYGGTGIGLALCKRIVERHGGKIWVDSIPGQGSTFSFTLPTSDPTSAEA